MTGHPIPDYLQLTPEEEDQIKCIRSMREVARAAQARQPQIARNPLPAYMEGAEIMTDLEVWARSGKLAEVKRALIDGVDVNAKDEKGMTALHYAVLRAEIRVVNLLLVAGADIEAKSAAGETPIELAARLKESVLVRLMRKEVSID
jgi:ankyrin repeat protein